MIMTKGGMGDVDEQQVFRFINQSMHSGYLCLVQRIHARIPQAHVGSKLLQSFLAVYSSISG